MVEVFKTNVAKESQGKAIVSSLNQLFPNVRITFDLDDCDNILRVEATTLDPNAIINHLHSNGFECEPLD